MFDDVDEFKKKAIDNKNDIKRESVDIIIGEDEQSFRISGIGEKAVKIEKYFRYEDIFKAVEDGKETGIEAAILKVIEDF